MRSIIPVALILALASPLGACSFFRSTAQQIAQCKVAAYDHFLPSEIAAPTEQAKAFVATCMTSKGYRQSLDCIFEEKPEVTRWDSACYEDGPGVA